MLRMALDRRPVRSTPGVRFAKLLGTGDGRTFAARDTDPRHWALLVAWDDERSADAFEDSRTVRAWGAISEEVLRVRLRPLASRGSWSGRVPFGDPRSGRTAGPVAAVTRARVKTSRWRTFWKAVPPVSTDLAGRAGLVLAMGIGEAPIGLQGTFSLWSDSDSLREFAHRGAAHAAAISATSEFDWYAEELFARFAVERAEGSYRGTPVDLTGEDAPPGTGTR